MFGTPHFGADRVRWLSTVKSLEPLMARPRSFFKSRGRPSKLVDALVHNSSELSNISEDFRALARQFAIVSFYETEAWPGTHAPIVDRMSSAMFLDHEEQIPLEANHMDLCRFEGEADLKFWLVCRRIQQVAKGVGDIKYMQ